MANSNLTRRIRIFGNSLILGLIILGLVGIYFTRARQLDSWSHELSNISFLVAKKVSQDIYSANLILDTLEETINAQHFSKEEDYRLMMSSEKIFNLLKSRVSGVSEVDVVTIVASNGDNLNFSRSYPVSGINLSERDYFKFHQSNPSKEIYISSPVQNKGNRKWTFYITKRVNDIHGEFLGLVLVGISVKNTTNFFIEVANNIGQNVSLGLFRADFTLLARHPENDELIGKVNTKGAAYQVLGIEKKDDDITILNNPRFGFDAPEKRIAAIRKLKNYPLVVSVIVPFDVVLSTWKHSSGLLLLVLLLSCIAIFWGVQYLVKSIEDRERSHTELKELKESAEKANDAKTKFLATMSHEIRTPMNGILGISQILMKDKAPQAEREKLIKTIYHSGKSLQTLLNDVLDMSKIEAGRMELSNSVFDPKQLAEEVATLFQENAKQKNLSLEVVWTGPKLHIYRADPIRIQQIVSNLTNNAIKFSKKGSIRIEVTELSRNEKFSNIEFSIKDTGIGISIEDQQKLFKPFSQVGESHLTPQSGTGLGLSIVRNLVDLMGGKYGVESQLGKGSRFWVQIPVELISNDEDLYNSEWSETTNQLLERESELGGKVLIVEDNPTNRMVLSSILTTHGIEILEAEDGKKGVEAFKNHPDVNLILMDVQMPVMDGILASKMIRELEKEHGFKETPIIAVTAFAYEEDRRKCLDVGMNDFLSKPIDIPALDKILQNYLHLKPHNEVEDVLLDTENELRRKIMVNRAEKVFDPEYMLSMLGFNKKLAKVIIGSARQDVPNYLEKLTKAINDDNWQEVKAVTHTLKGVLAQIGGVRIAKQVKELDDAIRGGARINIDLVSDLKVEYDLLIVLLDQWMELA